MEMVVFCSGTVSAGAAVSVKPIRDILCMVMCTV